MTDILPRRAAGDLRPAIGPPDLREPTADDNKHSAGWDWANQDDAEAIDLADALDRFVNYFNHRYPWTREQTIPPCWAQHGALIEELTSLMWSRWAAFQGPLAAPDAAQTWHTTYLPLFAARMTTWIGVEAAADCRSGHHRPSRLTDPDPAAAGPPPPDDGREGAPLP